MNITKKRNSHLPLASPKPVVIAGSGRSGTTWVLDSLALPNRLRTVFEPLNSQCVPKAKNLDSLYLAPQANEPECLALLTDILGGQLRNVWSDYRINPRRLNPAHGGWKQGAHNVIKLARNIKAYRQPKATGRAVKFIRANLLLPWISAHFDLRALLVVRHPCAVIASRLALGGPNWDAQTVVDRYRRQPALMELLNERFAPVDLDGRRPAATLAWVWCVENVLPMMWADEYGYPIVFYENLLASPGTEWARVAGKLGLEAVPDAGLRRMPSQQVSKDMRNKTFDASHVGQWRSKLSAQQVAEIDELLTVFGVQPYRVDDPMPPRTAAEAPA